MAQETFCWVVLTYPGDPQFINEIYGPMVGWELEEIEKSLEDDPLDPADFPENARRVLCRVWREEDSNEHGSAHWWNIEPVEPLRVEMVPEE